MWMAQCTKCFFAAFSQWNYQWLIGCFHQNQVGPKLCFKIKSLLAIVVWNWESPVSITFIYTFSGHSSSSTQVAPRMTLPQTLAGKHLFCFPSMYATWTEKFGIVVSTEQKKKLSRNLDNLWESMATQINSWIPQ